MSSTRTVGVALDGTRLTIVWRTTATAQDWRTNSVACDATAASVARAVSELTGDSGQWSMANISLMRPLANMRTLRFPRMPRSVMARVLERDWARYVIGIRATPHTVAARVVDQQHWRATFAPTETLDALATAADVHGWKNVRVLGSDDAIAMVARTLSADARDAAGVFVLVCDGDGPTDGVYLRNWEPVVGRRFAASATDDDAVAFIAAVSSEGAESQQALRASVIIIGATSRATALVRAVSTSSRRAGCVDIGAPAGASAAAIIAIAGTFGTPSLAIRSPVAQHVWRKEMRQVTRWLAGAAAAAFVLAFVIDTWSTESSLADVRAHRADISAHVARAMSAHSRVNAMTTTLATLAAREADASRASDVMTAITVTLPVGAALTTLSVSGDSVSVEGESTRSAAVYETLRTLPVLERVGLTVPVRQERQAGDVAIERFAFNARIKPAR
ncbi:MAG: hypothetical protein JWM95_450 [Gemmatimonadetes bacterium]|nr:hypothetical protein [Gemmatimonadota bacterium]